MNLSKALDWQHRPRCSGLYHQPGRTGTAAVGPKNNGRSLSRIDEWTRAADLRECLRYLVGPHDRGSRIGKRVRGQQRRQPATGLFAGPAIVTVSEIVDYNCVITANVNIPVVADVDDFGATPLDLYRFAKQCERGGIACAAFDDRSPLNRAMGYAAPGVLPKAQMIDNIHAAADARTDMILVGAA